jgi:hypothetical protein
MRYSAWGQPLGLDELMIVNPSPAPVKAATHPDSAANQGHRSAPAAGQYFLGEDGTLYQTEGAGTVLPGQFFLGEDGTLYQLQMFDPRL